MKSTLITLVLMSVGYFLCAQEKAIPLYGKDIPNSKKAPASYVQYTDTSGLIRNVTNPSITPFFPKKGTASGTAVIICPGGGYAVLASAEKSALVAKAFNQAGIAAFVLNYRLPSDEIMVDKTIGPLQDAQTALLLIRKRAAEWGLNPHKIGFVGISAGGHLATTAATHFDQPVIDNKEQIDLRPDFMVLVYSVILFDTAIESGTRENLIGAAAQPALLNQFSNEKHVTANTPPAFLVHAADDDVVPVKNSLVFYNALLAANVKASMHIFQSGGHGFGLDNPNNKDKWFDSCRNWLRENGF
ncbi:alpha/beta hydrolase [Paraflavitalea soli]|uniref:alpha/beta hydrolase n=1 Tax=Paraflavitalea soli TaxID=2315862 RepID=UPI001B863DDA|nr:alpha/beta hydrolase [Paraflavitalea soli]